MSEVKKLKKKGTHKDIRYMQQIASLDYRKEKV